MAYASHLDRFMARLVMRQRRPGGRFVRTFLTLFGIEIPRTVKVGRDLKLPHATTGLVIHPNATIGDRVTIFHGVTVGRANVWEDAAPRAEDWGGADICDDAMLCAGSVVLIRDGRRIRVGRGTVIGANAVLTESTGDWEIWAGAPARRVGTREPIN